MNTVNLNLNKTIKAFTALAVLLTTISCGKGTPPPPPPPPTPPPSGPAGIGGGLEANPGNVQAFNIADIYTNVVGHGILAKVATESNVIYSVVSGNGGQQAALQPQGSPNVQQFIQSPMGYTVDVSVMGQAYGQQIPPVVLTLVSVGMYGQPISERFILVPNYPLAAGVSAFTTDQQGVFVSQGSGQGMPSGVRRLMKVALRMRNPQMQIFEIGQSAPMGGGFGGGGFGGGFGQPGMHYGQQFGQPGQPGQSMYQGPATFLQVHQRNLTTDYGNQPPGMPGGYAQNPYSQPGFGSQNPYGQPGYGQNPYGGMPMGGGFGQPGFGGQNPYGGMPNGGGYAPTGYPGSGYPF